MYILNLIHQTVAPPSLSASLVKCKFLLIKGGQLSVFYSKSIVGICYKCQVFPLYPSFHRVICSAAGVLCLVDNL